MSQLDPSLKRLLNWSRTAPVPSSALEEAPFGFSGRIAASMKPVQPTTLLLELQRSAWRIACASLVLLISGALVLLSEGASSGPGADISSTLNFVANNFLQ